MEAYKSEIREKESGIQKLRQELIIMQEKRDVNYSEIESQSSKMQQLESKIFFLEDEVNKYFKPSNMIWLMLSITGILLFKYRIAI